MAGITRTGLGWPAQEGVGRKRFSAMIFYACRSGSTVRTNLIHAMNFREPGATGTGVCRHRGRRGD